LALDFGSKSIFEFNDIVDTVSMVHDKATWLAIEQQLAFFAIAFDAASEQAVVVVSFLEEVPEAS